MATSSSRKNRYTATTLSFLALSLFTVFLFSRTSLEPALSLYRDLFVQASPASSLSSPRHTVYDSSADPEQLHSSTSHSLSFDAQTESVEPEPATDSAEHEISVNDEIHPVSDNELHSPTNHSLSFNAQTESVELEPATDSVEHEISVNDKIHPVSDNELHSPTNHSRSFDAQTVSVEPEPATDSAGRETSVNDKIHPVSDKESAAETVDDDNGRDLPLNQRLECDLYMGTWVKDENYPIYQPGSCPYVDEAYDCRINGRTDTEYTKWRWKPDGCDLPRFSATDFLARLRGKRLMLVGDSMNRNQFESILCILREGLHNKSKMYETHGHKITKGRGYFVFKFEDYDCTVEFVRSHFLVKEGVRINGNGNSNPTLSIDQIDKTSRRWKRADILVFNTGHWWTHGKTARGKNYYKEGNYIYPQFDAVEAYRRAIKTWAKWIDNNINPRKQTVYYRGYSSAHFRGGDWDSGGSCNGETEPVFNGSVLNNYPLKMKIVEEVITGMKVPVKLLNVTRLTNFRKDGHPSVYGKNIKGGKKVSTRRQDCSHWCLPGVPDAWNELIYATLVFQHTNSSS